MSGGEHVGIAGVFVGGVCFAAGCDLSGRRVSRWENAPSLRDLVRLMGVMVDLYCASYSAPPVGANGSIHRLQPGMFMDAMQFYHVQLRRYLLLPFLVLVGDFLLLFVLPEFPGKQPLIAVTSGSLGGFVRFLVAERIPVENLNDTANMFRYWASLAVGARLIPLSQVARYVV